MMIRARLFVALFACALVAACGVAGAPERPAAKTGVTLSGEVSAGIVSKP